MTRLLTVTLLFIFPWFLNAKPLPLEHFTKHGDYLDLKISPDGKYFAARVREKGAVVLLFIRREDGKITGGIKPKEGESVHSVTWVNNERVVYEFSEKNHEFDHPVATGELYGMNVDGSHSDLLYGYRASDERTVTRIHTKKNTYASQEVLSVLEDDKKNILIIEYPWEQIGEYWYDNRSRSAIISKLNIRTGKKRKVETIPYNNVRALSDNKGQVNFISWEEKDGTFRAAYRKKNKGDWKKLSDSFGIKQNLMPVSLNKGSTKVYLEGISGERDLATLYEIELASGKLNQLFDGLKSDLEDWIVDSDTLEPVVGVSYPNVTEYHYTKSESPISTIHKKLVRAFKGQDIFVTSRTTDGKLLVVSVQSDVNPGEFYIYNTETNKADFIWANRSWIDPRQMRQMESFTMKSRDGIELNGFITLPEKNTNKKLPFVVMVHGGPHGVRDHWEFDSEVQLLANRGYAVVQVNYRGSGGYGGKFMKLGYRQWGGKMIDDILDATRWAIDNKNLDPERGCIYGASYGGYAAMMAAVRDPGLFQCTIGYIGIYDLSLMYSKGDIPKSWGGTAYLEKVIGRDEAQLREFSPINHVDKLESPVMLIHGSEDSRAPIIHAKKMKKQLEKSGKKVVWREYKKSGHGVWDEENRKALYGGVLDFLENHIGQKKIGKIN